MNTVRSSRRKKYTRKKWLLLFVVAILLVVGIFTWLTFVDLSDTVETELTTLHELQAEIGEELYDSSILSSQKPTEVPAKITAYFSIESDIDSDISRIEKLIEDTDAAFLEEMGEYRAFVESYDVFDAEFVPDSKDLETTPFADKQEPTQIIQHLNLELFSQMRVYNETHNPNVFVDFEPEFILSQLTENEKKGMHLMFNIQGTSLSESDAAFIRDNYIGGVVLLGYNIESETQLQSLTAAIRELNDVLPIHVAIDQEGGIVSRIWWDNTISQRDAAGLSTEDFCDIYSNRDTVLAEAGITMNLGLVADVTADTSSFIYPRVFSSDYAETAELLRDALDCTKQTVQVLKHYPGHGATTLDTHQGLAHISKNEGEWKDQDGLPFIQNAAAAQAIMPGHLVLEWLDSEHPTSLSKTGLDYFRDEYDYDGLYITDDLFMLTQAGYDLVDASNQAITAGNDILLYSINDSGRFRVVDGILESFNEDSHLRVIQSRKNIKVP